MQSEKSEKAVVAILAVSAAAIGFLFWLIYFKSGSPIGAPDFIEKLPAMNAAMNGLSALSLYTGWLAIKRKNLRAHTRHMITAFLFSSLFLAGYITYYVYHGNAKFLAEGWIRPVYFFTLISHIVLSLPALPMVLITFYLSLTNRIDRHKKLARLTFPIWMYVSVTGVLVFVLQRLFNNT